MVKNIALFPSVGQSLYTKKQSAICTLTGEIVSCRGSYANLFVIAAGRLHPPRSDIDFTDFTLFICVHLCNQCPILEYAIVLLCL